MKSLQNNPQFKAFASSIDYGILVSDDNGKILDFNAALLKMFGYTEDELRDAPLTTIIPKRFQSDTPSGTAETLTGQTVRLYGEHKNGREFPIEMHISVWHNTSGDKYYTASVRKYSALENNLGWILASSAVATLSLLAIIAYLALHF